ncbi:hypothetical protein I316_04454 [Kwoniella heveanensis BCC8398]|uniref:Uncharacterized protein n=1 Tax=Kwoniella heveanensis BCC8398 TaxID=1296120 RepID=A0A1B9GRQ9_9TREE|nr:hypothetical protein I316_04454 [Kwoniella heveanensis BCC8398]
MAEMERHIARLQPVLEALEDGRLGLGLGLVQEGLSGRRRQPQSPLPVGRAQQQDRFHLNDEVNGEDDSRSSSERASSAPVPVGRRDASVQTPQVDYRDAEHRQNGTAGPPSELNEGVGICLYDENGKPRWMGSHNTFAILDAFFTNREPNPTSDNRLSSAFGGSRRKYLS